MTEFYTQGAVPVSSSAYISRAFEERLIQEVLQGRWVLLLGPRQHGKSTALVRLKAKLKRLYILQLAV